MQPANSKGEVRNFARAGRTPASPELAGGERIRTLVEVMPMPMPIESSRMTERASVGGSAESVETAECVETVACALPPAC